MKYLGMLILMAMCTFGCTPRKPPSKQEVTFLYGRAHYRVNCASCHNQDPKLAGPVGPKLWNVSRDLLIERLPTATKECLRNLRVWSKSIDFVYFWSANERAKTL